MGVHLIGAGIGAGGAIFFGDGKGTGNRLGVRAPGGFTISQSLFKQAWQGDRAGIGALSATGAFGGVYVSGCLVQGQLEISGCSCDVFNL
jgi:hypothetical protein